MTTLTLYRSPSYIKSKHIGINTKYCALTLLDIKYILKVVKIKIILGGFFTMKNLEKTLAYAITIVFVLQMFIFPVKAETTILDLPVISDTWTGNSSDDRTNPHGAEENVKFRAQTGMTMNDNTFDYSLGYYKFELPNYVSQGKTISSATLKLYQRAEASEVSAGWNFYIEPNNWNEATFNYSSAHVRYDRLKAGTITLAHQLPNRISYPTGGDYVLHSFDVTDLITQYDVTVDTVISFAMMPYNTTAGRFIFAASKEHSNAALHPKLEIELQDVTDMSIINTSPTPNSEVAYTDEIYIHYNNSIDVASVTTDMIGLYKDNEKIDLDISDISVNFNTININKELEPYCIYDVIITSGIADIYGSSLDEEYRFTFVTTPVYSVITLTSADYQIADAMVSENSPETNYSPSSGNNRYIYPSGRNEQYTYTKIDLSSIPQEASISKATYFYFYSYNESAHNIRAYAVEDTTWDAATLNYNTSPPIGDLIATAVAQSSTGSMQKASIDITEYIRASIAQGKSNVSFAWGSILNASIEFSAARGYSVERHTLTVEYDNNPIIAVKSSTPAKNSYNHGVGEPIILNMATDLVGFSPSQIALKNTITDNFILLNETNTEYNESARTITIDLNEDLSPLTPYSIILKAGMSDKYGNILDSDKTVLSFLTSSSLEISDIKISSDIGVNYDGCTQLGSIIADSNTKAIVKIVNTSTNPQNAILIYGLYDSNNNLISVDFDGINTQIPGGETVEYEAFITIPSENVSQLMLKAFMWNNISEIRPIGDYVFVSN